MYICLQNNGIVNLEQMLVIHGLASLAKIKKGGDPHVLTAGTLMT